MRWRLVAVSALAPLVPALAAADADERDEEARAGFVQELFLGETPFPQEQGEVQISLGAERTSGDEADVTTSTLSLEVGLTDAIAAGVSLPYVVRDAAGGEEDADGLGDVVAELLLNLHAGEGSVVAAGLEIGLPTGDEEEELGEGLYEFEPSLRAGLAVGEGWLLASVGGELAEGEPGVFGYGAAVTQHLLGPLTGVLELSGEASREETDTRLVPGLHLRGPVGTELQVGVPVGLGDDADDWGIVALATVEF